MAMLETMLEALLIQLLEETVRCKVGRQCQSQCWYAILDAMLVCNTGYMLGSMIFTDLLPHQPGFLQQRYKCAGGSHRRKTQRFWLQLGRDSHHL